MPDSFYKVKAATNPTCHPPNASKIAKLVQEEYTLRKQRWLLDFKNSSGDSENIWGLCPLQKSPAGLSWAGALFPFAACVQIKEWSYLYVASSLWAIASLIQGITGVGDSPQTGVSAFTYGSYGYMLPYLRKIAKDTGTKDLSKAKSIITGSLLSWTCLIPSIILDVIFGNL